MDKPLIVLLPGANHHAGFYRKFAQLLATDFEVYVMPWPGIGPDVPESRVNGHNEVEYLKYMASQISDFSQGREYLLMGFSLGGYMAIKYALQEEGGRIKRLVLLSPLTRLHSRFLPETAANELLNELQNVGHDRTYFDVNLFSLDHLQYLPAKHRQTILATSELEITLEDVQSLTPPVQVFFGSDDLIVDSTYTQELFDQVEGAEVYVFEDTGHDAYALQAEFVKSEILNR